MRGARAAGGLAAVMIVTAALAACGEKKKSGTETAAAPAGSTADAGGAPAPSNATLRVSIPGDIDNFDPYTNQLIQYEWAVRNTVFSTLVRYDADLKIVADLAEPATNADATQFTLKLKDGVKFSDGETLDAAAVITSLKAAAKSKGIYAPRLAGVKSYSTPDASTVIIRLKSPDAAFLDGLTHIAIVAPDHLESARKTPVGSGPYTFVSWKPNSAIVLKRNPTYHGPKAPFAELVLKPITDEQVALNDLYAGDIDVVGSASTSTVKQVDASRATVVRPTTSNSMALVEYGKGGVVKDVKVRQALAYALDREAIKKIAYGDEGESGWSPLPTGSWAHKDESGYPFDVAKAKELISQAGAAGKTITFDIVSGTTEATQMGRVWQQALAKAGIKLKIRSSELSVWLDRYVKRRYDAIYNYFNVTSDPNSFFDVIMKPHLQDNYKNPEMDKLVTEGISTSDEAARKRSYAKLQDLMVQGLPVMTVQSRPLAAIAAKPVSSVVLNPLGWPLFDKAKLAGA